MTQALAVMQKAFDACSFQGKTMAGSAGECATIYKIASSIFGGVKWNEMFSQIDFLDGSAIECIRKDQSSLSVVFNAV